MSFRHHPPKHRRALRVILAVLYSLTSALGVTALIWTPVTTIGAVWSGLTWAFCLITISAGTLGLRATARGDWRDENWIAMLAATGCGCYAVIVWGAALDGAPTRIAGAIVATCLSLWWVFRSVEADSHLKRSIT